MIQQITEKDNFDLLAKLLNKSFLTVVDDFGITKENCPSNNAFIDGETLKNQLVVGREFYKLEQNNSSVGFIAIEKSGSERGTFYIEKVAVHLDFRHAGLGKQLMDFAMQRILELGGERISIGLIDANTKLKTWYQSQGYSEFCVKTFDHLPFQVCLMEKLLN